MIRTKMVGRYFEGASHAKLYLKFRQKPPQSFRPIILNYLREKYKGELSHMVDVGCGSGQSTSLFADQFKTIEGTDVSPTQIELAKGANKFTNVTFRACPAESIPAEAGRVQLITACQAAHWFDHPKFFAEVDRVLVPNGVVALSGFHLPRPRHKSDDSKTQLMCKLFDTFYNNNMSGEKYLGDGRAHLDNEYKDIPFPYEDCKRIGSNELYADADMTMEHFLGYVSTSSGLQNFKKINGAEATEQILNKLGESLCEVLETKKPFEEVEFQVRYPHFMVLGRKPERQ